MVSPDRRDETVFGVLLDHYAQVIDPDVTLPIRITRLADDRVIIRAHKTLALDAAGAARLRYVELPEPIFVNGRPLTVRVHVMAFTIVGNTSIAVTDGDAIRLGTLN